MSYSVGYLEPWNAKRICLGVELEDCYERMGKYLDEIPVCHGDRTGIIETPILLDLPEAGAAVSRPL